MTDFLLGPIWGHSEILKQLIPYLESGKSVVLCGGYLHFSRHNENIINDLIRLKDKYPNVSFAKSRFEVELMIAAGLSPEKNYHFQRWINPFSGLLSCIEFYGLSVQDYFRDPEAFAPQLQQRIKFSGHEDFFQNLKAEIVPASMLKIIDENIQDKSAFRSVTLFTKELKPEKSWRLKEDLLEGYLVQSKSSLREFTNEY